MFFKLQLDKSEAEFTRTTAALQKAELQVVYLQSRVTELEQCLDAVRSAGPTVGATLTVCATSVASRNPGNVHAADSEQSAVSHLVDVHLSDNDRTETGAGAGTGRDNESNCEVCIQKYGNRFTVMYTHCTYVVSQTKYLVILYTVLFHLHIFHSFSI